MNTAVMTAGPPPIPDVRWISLAHVAQRTDGHPEYLENGCIKLGIEMDQSGRGWPRIRVKDLAALIGEVKARSVMASIEPEWVKPEIASGPAGINWTELVDLAERRGVFVKRTASGPLVTYGSIFTLRRILEAERTFEIEDDDWFLPELVLPRMRAAQRTVISGGYEGEMIDTSDPNRPRFAGLPELVTRCRWMGIRYKQGGPDKTRRRGHFGPYMIVGFDLYRLLGIAMDDSKVPGYLEMMTAAYEAVLGPRPVPAA